MPLLQDIKDEIEKAFRWFFPATVTRVSGYYFGQNVKDKDGKIYTHWGVDFGTPQGSAIMSPYDGIVESAGWDNSGYGNLVTIRDINNQFITYLAHLSQVNVKPGDRVVGGQLIGLAGSTGNSTGAHLHLEIRKVGGGYINPSSIFGDYSKIKPGTPVKPGTGVYPVSGGDPDETPLEKAVETVKETVAGLLGIDLDVDTQQIGAAIKDYAIRVAVIGVGLALVFLALKAIVNNRNFVSEIGASFRELEKTRNKIVEGGIETVNAARPRRTRKVTGSNAVGAAQNILEVIT